MKHIMLGSAMDMAAALAILSEQAVFASEPERRAEPIKIPRSMRCYHTWEERAPNDDWRGKGNKKRRIK